MTLPHYLITYGQIFIRFECGTSEFVVQNLKLYPIHGLIWNLFHVLKLYGKFGKLFICETELIKLNCDDKFI